MIDNCGRNIDYVRISITDRCNLRCVYCMPACGVQSFEHNDILTYEEIVRIVGLLTQLGIKHVRLTGGEPTVRKGYMDLIEQIHQIPGVETISMTTNGLLLAGKMDQAKKAGLHALNLSLDTTDPDTYKKMARGGDLQDVLSTIREALALGIRVKINAVPVRGMNDKDLVGLVEMAKDNPVCVRFIELMPLGCGANLEPIESNEVLDMMEAAYGELAPDTTRHGFGPAKYVKPEGFAGSIGVISPMSHEFCDQCNRVRLTADGYLKLCLNHRAGLDLREMLRSGMSDEMILSAMEDAIAHKPRRHGFKEAVDDREVRRMNEIGG